ncbi:very short patch repair endonuclease [Mesorhizobium sp. M1273]|uniref:very short patch repair endonuclease n=1 Tax=Mesorhizobium sp. M1273 TaxID=2957075 RepID=UPI003336F232
MTDPLSPERRGALMARVKQRNTKPEMTIRQLLHSRGWRYRIHVKNLPGTPDIVFPRRKVAIFVHGCFWHGHSCKLGSLPKTRSEFWSQKIVGNRQRDDRKRDELQQSGWQVLIVWQCELADQSSMLQRIESFLSNAASC